VNSSVEVGKEDRAVLREVMDVDGDGTISLEDIERLVGRYLRGLK
jgi:hypothetical protein